MNFNTNRPYKHNLAEQDLIFPIQAVTDKEKIKEYHRKKLLQSSLKPLGQIPQLEQPNSEQDQWINRKLKGSFP